MENDNYSAILSPDGIYRYQLGRRVGDSSKTCVFIMLNPSTADMFTDDPTIRRCKGFARDWGCGRLLVVNLFAYRATDPEEMKAADDPVGPINDQYIIETARQADKGFLICAWGNHGRYNYRDHDVITMLETDGIQPMCLRITKTGMPNHPVRLPGNLKPIKYDQI